MIGRSAWSPACKNSILELILLFALLLLSASIVPESVATPPSIQVPVLKNWVRLDGKISSTAEWSDASETSLILLCATGCDLAPVDMTQLTLWTKHDDKWFYFLYRVDWPGAQVLTDSESVRVRYSWKAPTPWEYQDSGLVGTSRADDYWVSYAVSSEWLADVDVGGRDNVEGKGTHDGRYYWFEFRKELNSGDGADWVFEVGNTYGNPLVDGLLSVDFARSTETVYFRFEQNVMVSLCPCSASTTAVPTAVSTGQATISTPTTIVKATSTTTTGGQALAVQMPFGSLGLLSVGILALLGVASTFLIIRRRKAPQITTTLEQTPAREEPLFKKGAPPPQVNISTGYADLDRTLNGGIPEGYAVVFVSPSYDERDLLLRRIVEKSLGSQRPALYVSNDLARTQDLVGRYQKGFYAFSSEAEKVSIKAPNLFKVPGIENLSDSTISLSLAIREARSKENANKMIIILDILSDLLLQHKAITTRKWLSDFVAKRKAEGFTIIATLNPLIGTKEETQAIIDFFDGVVEIHERKLEETSRRFLIVKKMYGHRYSQSEIMLDFEKLWKS
jgi:KaiC/GvpD/RAD55 family RecA-like ATPase